MIRRIPLDSTSRRPLSLGPVTSVFATPEVASWYERRTYAFDPDPEAVRRKKRERPTTVGVGIPALNEAATIGDICREVKALMAAPGPLVDRLVVVDSGSSDGTSEAARSAGAEVFDLSDAPVTGGGKGAALYKSLLVLAECDLIVWLDGDVANFGSHFISGLLRPLLEESDIAFVKGFYERPLKTDAGLRGGGARVTELVARPLINLLFPELSGLVQPLSGECAFRRSAVEGVRLFTGYGVDIGLVIDIFERHGLNAIAQADLGVRVHDNKDVQALGRMAHQVVQAMLVRLEELGRIKLQEEPSSGLVQFGPTPRTTDLQITQLPPIATRA